MDFYSLLTGISVWKELNIGEEDTNDEDIPNSLFFNCKLQLFSSSLDGDLIVLFLFYVFGDFVGLLALQEQECISINNYLQIR